MESGSITPKRESERANLVTKWGKRSPVPDPLGNTPPSQHTYRYPSYSLYQARRERLQGAPSIWKIAHRDSSIGEIRSRAAFKSADLAP